MGFMACCSITTQYKLPNWFELFRSKLFNSSKTNSKYNDKNNPFKRLL